MSGDKSKIQCCKEQYCIGTWNVRSMNQGKLDMVKQEMQARSLDCKDPLEKEMATHSNILIWEIPRTEETGRLRSVGLQRVRHNLETKP